jgi:hypothetical protein
VSTGVTLFEAADAALVPRPFVVVTVNVYAVPSVSPVTVTAHVVAEACAPPGDAVTVYDVIVAPPLLAGGVQLTVACWSPATAVIPVGGADGPVGVTAGDAAEAGPVLTWFAAVTVNV